MQGQAWDAMLRRIPKKYHEGIIFATMTGAEIVLQTIVSVDDNYLILKGRPSGTNDNGKLMILPLKQINYLSFPKKISDEEISAMFSADANFAEIAEDEKEIGESQNGTGHNEDETSASQASQEAQEKEKKSQPSKTVMLAKLRERLQMDSHKSL